MGRSGFGTGPVGNARTGPGPVPPTNREGLGEPGGLARRGGKAPGRFAPRRLKQGSGCYSPPPKLCTYTATERTSASDKRPASEASADHGGITPNRE